MEALAAESHKESVLNKFKRAPVFVKVILLAVLALLIEIFVFNSYYFTFDRADNPKYQISLPFNASVGKPAVFLSKDNNQLVVNDLNLHISNVSISTKGANAVTTGKIFICDQNALYQFKEVNNIEVNPGGEFNDVISRIDSRGNAVKLAISFDLPYQGQSVIIDKLIINDDPSFDFNAVRAISVFLLAVVVFLIVKFKLYNQNLDFSKKSHKISQWIVIVFSFCVSLYILTVTNPNYTNPIYYTYYANAGSFPIGNHEHSWLLTPPKTQEDVKNSDPYVQLLDAFNKGQLYIDYPVDPRLEQLNNMFDYSERMAKGVYGLYDKVYYNGHYYLYFGVAPLVIYYPIYWITGKVPSLPLSTGIATLFCIFTMFAAFKVIVDFFKPRANLLIFLAAELACIGAGLVYYHHGYLYFYDLPYLFAFAFSSLFIVSVFKQFIEGSKTKRRLYLLLGGICVVMVALSRPPFIFMLLCIAIPVFYVLLKRRLREGQLSNLLLDSLFIIIPVILGAIFAMWYNYARFDSPISFGILNMVGIYDLHYNVFSISFREICSFIFIYLFEPFNLTKDFPFISLARPDYQDFGHEVYVDTTMGIFQMPYELLILFGVFLFVKGFNSQISQEILKIEKIIFAALLVVSVIVAYNECIYSAFTMRYVFESVFVLNFMVFLLTLQCVRCNNDMASVTVYAIVLTMLLYSFIIGLLFTFQSGFIKDLNPDAYLAMREIFSPFNP